MNIKGCKMKFNKRILDSSNCNTNYLFNNKLIK